MKKYSSTMQETTAYARTIRQLQEDLYIAQSVILSLMPKEAKDILTSYNDCASPEATYRWVDSTAKRVIEIAETIPEDPYRAFCPLCGEGSISSVVRGFSYPEGLRRHLIGWGDRIHQCSVIQAVNGLARQYWKDKFPEQW